MSVRGLGVGVDERVYACDVPSCDVSRRGRKPQDAGFWMLTGPEAGFMPAGKRHFCSLGCIQAWVHMADPSSSDPVPLPVQWRAPVAPPIPVDLDAECEPVDVAPLYPDGDAPGRVTSARDWRPRRSSVSE